MPKLAVMIPAPADQVRNIKNVMESKPKVGIGVYIIKDGKLLLLKRKGAHGKGSWCPPGGHLEMGESFVACAKREAKEEAGIEIKNVKLAGVTNDISNKETHYVTIAMIAQIKSGKPQNKEPEKATDFGWFDIKKLPSPLFLPVKHFLRDYKLDES